MSLNNIRPLGSHKRTQPQQASLLCFLPSLSLSPLQLERINYWFSARLIITINCQIHLRVYCRDINNTLTLQSFGLCRVSSGGEGKDRGGSPSRIHYPPQHWSVTACFFSINKNKRGKTSPIVTWSYSLFFIGLLLQGKTSLLWEAPLLWGKQWMCCKNNAFSSEASQKL